MPISAPTPCRHPSCATLVKTGAGYCDKHRKAVQQQADEKRGSSAARGYDSKWQSARAGYLYKHPLCVVCERNGSITAANVVDHITPHKGDKALFWDSANWQALCKRCHDTKTAREDGGWGRGH